MADTAVATIVATLISAVAAVLVGYYTQRSAARAAAITSRTDIERDAFERAKGYYTDTIDRQSREIEDLEDDVAHLKERVTDLETELHQTREELNVAKTALHLQFPDE